MRNDPPPAPERADGPADPPAAPGRAAASTGTSGTSAWDPAVRDAVMRFAAGMAHDFGNLVTIIRGFSELAQVRTRDDAQLADWIGEILGAVGRATDLLEELTVIGRRRPLNLQPCDLAQVLPQAVAALRDAVGSSMRVELALPASAIPVRVDPAGVALALVRASLLMKSVASDGGALTVSADSVQLDAAFRAAHPWARQAGYACVGLHAAGGPLRDDDLRHLAEPFYPVLGLRRGLGLSFAAVDGWMTLHGGGVLLESSPQTGTVCRLYFPLA